MKISRLVSQSFGHKLFLAVIPLTRVFCETGDTCATILNKMAAKAMNRSLEFGLEHVQLVPSYILPDMQQILVYKLIDSSINLTAFNRSVAKRNFARISCSELIKVFAFHRIISNLHTVSFSNHCFTFIHVT